MFLPSTSPSYTAETVCGKHLGARSSPVKRDNAGTGYHHRQGMRLCSAKTEADPCTRTVVVNDAGLHTAAVTSSPDCQDWRRSLPALELPRTGASTPITAAAAARAISKST